jgi:UDP-glucose 4-epimerase
MQIDPPSVLVTGGAGYIGSHLIHQLIENQFKLVVLDNLSRGTKDLLPAYIPFVVGDVGNTDLIRQVIKRYKINSVVHLAGSIVVPESVAFPLEYYQNNVENSRRLIKTCIESKINNFVFASTAAVYGSSNTGLLDEKSVTYPVSPYGKTKLTTEWIIEDAAAAHRLNYVILRFFNVAGADAKLRTGQVGEKNTHLIKVACEVATGTRKSLEIFGVNYPTPDGTCIRDYVHVSDLASALTESIDYLKNGGQNTILNCGYGVGTSVNQVIESINHIQQKPLNIIHRDRRLGDVSKIVADTSLIKKTLKWKPKFDNITAIINSALQWEKSNTRKILESKIFPGGKP